MQVGSLNPQKIDPGVTTLATQPSALQHDIVYQAARCNAVKTLAANGSTHPVNCQPGCGVPTGTT